MRTLNVSLEIYGQKKHIIFLKAQIFLFFSEASLFTFLYGGYFYTQTVLSVFSSTTCVMFQQPVSLRLLFQ